MKLGLHLSLLLSLSRNVKDKLQHTSILPSISMCYVSIIIMTLYNIVTMRNYYDRAARLQAAYGATFQHHQKSNLV